MGQKVNPHGLRVGVIKDWDSHWYAREDKVGDLVVEDYNIRKYLKNKLYAAGVAKIEIERSNGKVKINIHCSRPGVVIGKAGAEIAKGQPLHLALAGNQNCGKTTLFNQLTGANQHVGNFPGVTVDRKDGTIRNHPEATVTDLPGIYSLSPYSNEEIVTRDFLMNDRPSGIINIVDATNIERNLYLTMQLMELEIPMVLALSLIHI